VDTDLNSIVLFTKEGVIRVMPPVRKRYYKKEHHKSQKGIPKISRVRTEQSSYDKRVAAGRMESQAVRVLRRFGGPQKLARTLKMINQPKDVVTLYRWTYPKSKRGTGGFIPAKCMGAVLEAARVEGIYLTSRDLDPRETPIDPLGKDEIGSDIFL
jgi:hypothetical protein